MSSTPRRSKKVKPKYAYHKVKLNQQMVGLKRTLSAVIADVEIRELLYVAVSRYLRRFYHASLYLEGEHHIDQFISGAKRRSQELQSMIYSAYEAREVNTALKVIRVVDGEDRIYKYKYENNLSIIDRDEEDIVIYSNTVHPKSYSELYRVAFTLIHHWVDLEDNNPNVSKDIKTALQLLISISRMYENLRAPEDYIVALEHKALETMTIQLLEDESNVFRKAINETIAQISFLVQNPRERVPKLLRSIVYAMRNTKFEPFSDQDYHLSLRSTGTKEKGKMNGSVPGLFASLVEVNNSHPIDDIIGYNPSYRENAVEGFSYSSGHTISIEKSSGHKPRIIHITDNINQDRCNWVHRKLANILHQMEEDCTFRQSKGVIFAETVTSPSYIETNKNSVYCADLSDATGNISQSYQLDVLTLIFGPELAREYMSILTQDKEFRFSDRTKKKFKQTMGQPQGYKGSFPAFALAHHIVVLTAIRLVLGSDISSRDIYRIVGDDIIMSYHDPDRRLLQSYYDVGEAVHFVIHNIEEKGNLFDYTKHSVATAEFAKVTVVSGRKFTPFPLKLILNNDGQVSSLLQLISWDSQMNDQWHINQVITKIQELVPELDNTNSFTEFMRASAVYKTSSLFSSFSTEDVEIDPRSGVITVTSSFNTMLQQALLDQLIPDHLRDNPNSKDVQPFLDLSWEDRFLSSVPNNHKYVMMLQRNQMLIDALEDLYSDKPVLSRAVIALDIKPEDFNIIYSVVDIINNDPSIYLNQKGYLSDMVERFQDCVEMFSLRSYVKRRKAEASLLGTAFRNYVVQCQKSGLFD